MRKSCGKSPRTGIVSLGIKYPAFLCCIFVLTVKFMLHAVYDGTGGARRSYLAE